MVDNVKTRKVSQKDWDKVETFVTDVHQERKTSRFRKEHERIWKEIDRQISMEPPVKLSKNGRPQEQDWHNAIQLGELSSASEIITSDVMRIMFPQDRTWFSPHVQIAKETGQNRQSKETTNLQAVNDGLLRNFMAQQHKDFGLKARFRLSLKESLHHGSFAAEVKFEKQMMVRRGSNIKSIGAPVWVPYSMWNTFPDPSPSVIGTNIFYTGAMILVEYMPLSKFKRMSGEGWMQERMNKIEKKDKDSEKGGDEVEIVNYKGDITIDRNGDDIYLPNSEVKIANGKLVYYKPAELPYPNVIFSGYERQDIRSPYYTSPIIKMSPTHTMTTFMANKFMDATALKVEPPVEYDASDPDYVMSGGPLLAPGAKTATRSVGAGFKALDIGDPRYALDAYTLGSQQMKEGLGVSSNRSGVRDADRETATSANLANQGAEVRTMEFVSQLEPQAMLPFLYMQHEYNREHLEEYTFYNDEMNTDDFIVIDKSKIQEDVHFDVVGSRGVLGEEKRDRKIAETVAFFSGNPLFAPKLNVEPIMLEMFGDAGKKNSEQWLNIDDGKPQIPPEVEQKFQELQQAAQKLDEENKMLKSKHADVVAKIESDNKQFAAKLAQDAEQFKKEYELERMKFRSELQSQYSEKLEKQIEKYDNTDENDARVDDIIGKTTDAISQLEQKLSEISDRIESIGSKEVIKVEKIRGKNGRMATIRKHFADGSMSDVTVQ